MHSCLSCSFTTVATTLAVLFGLSLTGYGYVLDPSCDPYKDLVVEGMTSAFDIGKEALEVFLSRPGGGPIGDAQNDLISYLFAEAKSSNDNWDTVQSKFNSVAGYNRNAGRPEGRPSHYQSLPNNGLILFCDFSRYKENQDCQGNKKPGYVCDSSLGFFYKMSATYSDCKSPGLVGRAVEAVTMQFTQIGVNAPSTIQLCPWYLKEVQKHEVRTLKGVGKALSKLSKWMDDPLRTAMDAANTFSGTLLHEMTHAIPNAPADDVNDGDRYGWKNCKKLSKAEGINNADSYALFAIGAKMIAKKGERPMEDGSIQPLPGAARQKRDRHDSHASRSKSSFGASSMTQLPFFRPSTFRTSTHGTRSPRLPLSGAGSRSPSGFSLSLPGPRASPPLLGSSSSSPPSLRSSDPPSPSLPSSGPPSSGSGLRSSRPTTVNPGPTASDPSPSVSPSDSPSRPPVTRESTENTMGTPTPGSSTSASPSTVITVSKSGTTSHVTYTPTYTSNDEIKPTLAWICTGPLCDTGSDCIVPLLCSKGGGGGSWGLCCDWKPPPPPGGGPPPPGGPSPGPSPGPPPGPDPSPDPPDEDHPSNSPTKTFSHTETQSTGSNSQTKTSSSTEAQSTGSSRSATSRTSRSSSRPSSTMDQQEVTPLVFADRFNEGDPAGASWYDKQQSILSKAMADTAEPSITWTPTSSSSGPKTTRPTSPTSRAPSSSKATASTTRPSASSGSISASTPISPTPPAPSSSEATAPTMSPPASSGSKSVSPSITTTTASPTRDYYPCYHAGGPRRTTDYCACATTMSGEVYRATAPATSGQCDMYTTFPSKITPVTTTEPPVLPPPMPTPITLSYADGEVVAYPSREINTYDVYGTVSIVMTEGAGQATTLVPPAPTEVSGNNDGANECQSTGDACERAYKKFEDNRLYQEYAGYAADVETFPLQDLTFGKARCIARFECDDYGLGMTGKQIKQAVEKLVDRHNAGKCGNTNLSNTCSIQLDYCTNCDDDH